MSFDWKKIVAALLTALAAQGGWLGVVAGLIAQYLLPLIGANEKLTLSSGVNAESETAPGEFKSAVREYLTALVNKIQRPLVRLILRNIVASLSDTILDTVWGIVTGKTAPPAPAMAAESAEDADMSATALAEVHAEAKKVGVKFGK
jgi:hypothetical protein